MLVEKDIVAISIPFSAGVAMAAAMPSWGSSHYWAAAVCCIASAALATAFCRKGGHSGTGTAMFMAAGMMSYFSASISTSAGAGGNALAEKALELLTSLIESSGFGDGGTCGLVKALLTGQREDLGRETVETFRAAGASHILALSGLHLGVIYGMLGKATFWAGHGRVASICRTVLTICAAGIYVMATGASPSVVRAFLFIGINELARLLPGRKRKPMAVFCTALMIQLMANPLIIRSAGFQLSYLAMLGIYTLFPVMDGWYPSGLRLDPVRRIWSAAALTIACQIFTAPVAWYHFHTFPKYFLLTNLVALPLSEMLIICSVLAITASAAGINPAALSYAAGILGDTLVRFLEAMASLP